MGACLFPFLLSEFITEVLLARDLAFSLKKTNIDIGPIEWTWLLKTLHHFADDLMLRVDTVA
jgi:hypothetical protein